MLQTKIIAIDQGTTSTKALLLDSSGKPTVVYQKMHRQITPHQGWVEHDPEEIYSHILAGLRSVPDIDGIGLSHQGETIVAWDAQTKEALYNMIVWQDQRTEKRVQTLKEQGHEPYVQECTGLLLDPYFPASKMAWLLENVDAVKSALAQNRLRIGTSESFFLDRLTGEYATDYNSASRTSLFNAETLQWDEKLCKIFSIPIEILPPVRSNIGIFGSHTIQGKHVPVTAVIIDQFASVYGHGCRTEGDSKATFGTGAFMQVITGNALVIDRQTGLSSALFWKFGEEAPVYGLDAGVYNVASAINWAKGLGLFDSYAQLNHFDAPTAIERDLVFVPALSGLACPHWDRSASGIWSGLSLETGRLDMMQSVLEGIAFRAAENFETMNRFTTLGNTISVDGGLTQNPYFLQFLADIMGKDISVPDDHELTGYGTALLAYRGLGLEAPQAAASEAVIFQPKEIDRTRYVEKFERVLQKSKGSR